MGQSIEDLAAFVARTRWDDIPPPVQRHAKLVLLDTLGVMLAGSVQPDVAALRARLAAGGPATAYGQGWPGADARTAGLLNGIAGRSIELCEGHRLVSTQAAMQVVPGLLAVGEAVGAAGRELLVALVLGYEVAGRLCGAFTARALAHQNGQATLLAAVAASMRMLGADAAHVSLAMRIATTLIVTPSYTNAVAGATTLNVAGGMSSFAAALVPELVESGFAAQPDAIEESLGQLVGAGFRAEGLADGLGESWHITRNYFRLYACCNPIHPALDALAAVLADLRPAPEVVDRIDIATYRFASVMRNPDPPNYFASKYSLPHAAAALVARGAASHATLDAAAVHDPVIAALRRRVHVVEDPTMSAVAPRLRPARVTVTLTDGRSRMHEVESHRGDFHQPFTEAELSTKFRELAGGVLTAQGAVEVERSVADAERWASVAELVALMRRHGR